ncbi:hypothetical protein ACFX2I_027936 [Malus domestica]
MEASLTEMDQARLGRGPVSPISQMSSSIDGKFSYCLVHAFSGFNSSSTMSFGNEAVVSGATAFSTPLLSSGGSKYLGVSLNPSLAPAKGNIIVDSGTTLTLLPEDLYNKLELTVSKSIRLRRLTDPSTLPMPLLQDQIDYQSSDNHCAFHWCRCEVTSFQHFLLRASMDVVCFAFRPIR